MLGLTGAKKISDTRVTFAVDSPWVEQVKIWDGEAYVVLPGGARPALPRRRQRDVARRGAQRRVD